MTGSTDGPGPDELTEQQCDSVLEQIHARLPASLEYRHPLGMTHVELRHADNGRVTYYGEGTRPDRRWNLTLVGNDATALSRVWRDDGRQTRQAGRLNDGWSEQPKEVRHLLYLAHLLWRGKETLRSGERNSRDLGWARTAISEYADRFSP